MYRGNLNRKYAEWAVWFGIYVILMHSILKISLNRMSKPGANENRSGRGKTESILGHVQSQDVFQKTGGISWCTSSSKNSSESHLDFQIQTRAPHNCGPSSHEMSQTVLQIPKLPRTCVKWWVSNLAGEPDRLQLWWEEVGDSSCTVDGEHGRSPSLLLWPFCFFPAV